MRLPSSELAWVPREKLAGYLLSSAHPVGSAKARFFRGFGFNEQNLGLLEAGLLLVARTSEVAATTETPYGTKYEIDGDLETPLGRKVTIRTVWIIEAGLDNPRFVTAFPA